MGAWWVGDHEIPPLFDDFQNIVLKVISGNIGLEQVATPRIVSFCLEGIPYCTAVFAGYEDSHHSLHGLDELRSCNYLAADLLKRDDPSHLRLGYFPRRPAIDNYLSFDFLKNPPGSGER